MAIQQATRKRIDTSLLDQVASEVLAKIATPGPLSNDGERKFRGSISDEAVSDIIVPALASATPITAASVGDVAYAKAVMGLAMVLGSYGSARDLLANP